MGWECWDVLGFSSQGWIPQERHKGGSARGDAESRDLKAPHCCLQLQEDGKAGKGLDLGENLKVLSPSTWDTLGNPQRRMVQP